jgi:hypothetical protein
LCGILPSNINFVVHSCIAFRSSCKIFLNTWSILKFGFLDLCRYGFSPRASESEIESERQRASEREREREREGKIHVMRERERERERERCDKTSAGGSADLFKDALRVRHCHMGRRIHVIKDALRPMHAMTCILLLISTMR